MQIRFERELTVRHKGQNIEEKGLLVIEGIEALPSGKYRCTYSIPVIHPEVHGFSADDPLQAMSRTIMFVRALILGSIKDGFEIWWKAEGDDGGFY